ncbi:MAG TPA: protein translocase subunit SecD [Actinospica sp.]|nr:protein translocase subunit SecD [Actinospica sp.]
MAAKKARGNKYSGLLSTRSRGAADQRPWRPLALLAVILVALYATMFGVNATHPRLAIDLAGGTSAVFTADLGQGKTPSAADMGQAVNIMQERVNGYGVSEATVTQEGSNTIDVEIPGQYSQATVDSIGATAHLYFRPVVVSASGTPTTTTTPSASATGTSTAKATGSASASASAAKASSSASSSASASSKASGQSESEAAVPDAATTSASADATGTASKSASAAASSSSSASSTAAASPGSTAQEETAYAAYQKLNCKNGSYTQTVSVVKPTAYLATCGIDGNKYLLAPSVIDGKDVTNASATPVTANGLPTGAYEVVLSFDAKGTKQFATETSTLYQQYSSQQGTGQFAITLDGIVQSAPAVNQGAITTGTASITGSFTQAQASKLATTLNYGSLPLTFKQSQVSIVSPTLGGSELQGGLIAGAIGLGLVFLYVILYYRGLSIAAISSLVVAAALTYSLACLFGPLLGFTLSLPGVAGLIVAIGITADSFVVFFERLRDELREGRSVRSAVRHAWTRARRTVIASDLVTLIAAVVLYLMTVGSVQGFAFTLGLSTVIDLVVIFMFTVPVVTLFARTNFFGNGHPWSGLDPESLGAQRQSYRAGSRGRMTIAERRRQEAAAAAGDGENAENNEQSVEA